jgi:hypothetical protein
MPIRKVTEAQRNAIKKYKGTEKGKAKQEESMIKYDKSRTAGKLFLRADKEIVEEFRSLFTGANDGERMQAAIAMVKGLGGVAPLHS